jgi:adenosylcobinamide-phosphate synthase
MTLLLGLLLERLLGDPQHDAHPVALFGRWAARIEERCYRDTHWAGFFAWLLTVMPPLLLVLMLHHFCWQFAAWAGVICDAGLLWASLGWRSLFAHVRAVLDASDDVVRREAVGRIVSRDTALMNGAAARRAAVESLAENASDGVVAPLFWFVVAGPVGAVLYRMINTLDAMWGYRNARFGRFGTVAARIDDAANWLPARLTAALFILAGRMPDWSELKRQAHSHASPNAGWTEASLAFAADVRLGGPVLRQGRPDARPWYGATAARDTDAGACEDALRVARTALLAAAALAAVVLYA